MHMHNEKLNNAINDSMSLLLYPCGWTRSHPSSQMPFDDTSILYYTYTHIYIGMYCGRTVGLKSCAYTIHIQVCTSGNKKLQGHTRTWKQTRQTAETIQFGRNMPKYIHFCYEILYCIEPMSEKFQFCPVAPCSNDRVVFASMLHIFIASVNKRKQHFWLTEDFILSPSSTASSWQSSRHKKKEIWNVLQG